MGRNTYMVQHLDQQVICSQRMHIIYYGPNFMKYQKDLLVHAALSRDCVYVLTSPGADYGYVFFKV